MIVDTIRDQLKQLRLPVASQELEGLLQKRKKTTDIQWLTELLEIELDARKDNATERRVKRASFPERRSLEQFDWNFNKKLPKEKIEELVTLKFIENNSLLKNNDNNY